MVYVVVSAFIILDMVTGLIKAIMNKEYTSTVMREGLFHKSGSILCILLGVLTDYAQTFLDLGISIPVATSICVYISIMEIGSIIENIGVINPEIMPDKMKSFFSKLSNNEKE